MRPLKRTGSQFLGGGRLPVPVPVLGTELLTDGDMEAANTTAWTATGTVATHEKSAAQKYAGAQSFHLVSNANTGTRQGYTAVVGTWYLASGYAYIASGGAKMLFTGGTTSSSATTTAASWVQLFVVGRAGATSESTRLLSMVAAADYYFDNVSTKAITLASMFSVRPYSTHVTVKAKATVVAGTRAGVVCNLDSATVPANFVFASHDGTTARLTKCVGGTYTELISTAVTYVAGAYVEIRRPAAGNLWQLFYNGSQVGTDQAIADAAIQGATLAGLFNTYSGNQLAAFSCVPS